MNPDVPEAQLQAIRSTLLAQKFQIAAERVLLAAERLASLLRKANFDPEQPRDDHGRWTDTGASVTDLIDGIDPDELLQDVAYPGDYHDVVRDHMVEVFRAAGHTVVTEVRLTLPGTPPITARLDILTVSPNGTLSGVEIKTGDNPTYTAEQAIVYPHAIGGAGVFSMDQKIRALGLTPGKPLPPFVITELYAAYPGAKLRLRDLPADPR